MVDLGNLDLFQILILPIVIVSLVPVYYFVRLYIKTRLTDFAIFAITYTMVPIAGVAYFLELSNDMLILHQILQLSLLTAYLLVMVIIIHMVFERKVHLIHILGFIWYVILVVIILLFKLETQPDEITWGSFSLSQTYSPYHPDGASTKFNGTTIYSTSHFLIGLLFIFFILIITLIGIYTFTPVNPTEEILRIKSQWFKVMLLHTLGWIFYLPGLIVFAGFGQLLIFLSHLGIAYIVIKNPELVLINLTQIVRAIDMYQDVLTLESDKISETGLASIIRYLQNLPEEVLAEIMLK